MRFQIAAYLHAMVVDVSQSVYASNSNNITDCWFDSVFRSFADNEREFQTRRTIRALFAANFSRKGLGKHAVG